LKKGLNILLVLSVMGLAGVPLPARAKVQAGTAYGINVFAGLFTGALVGAGAGAIGYARDRHNQDPQPMVLACVYGAVATAVGVSVPLAAYEVASDKPGVGSNALFDILEFAMIGGVVGSAGGTVSYRNKVGVDDNSAEDFLAAGGAGVCGGAIVGLFVGVYEALIFGSDSQKRPVGKGIHAYLGPRPEVGLIALRDHSVTRLRLAELEF
jgi:hypothetical protein